jgi:hypothetical protein
MGHLLTKMANHLKANVHGTVVMACGNSKTLVALWVVEQSNDNGYLNEVLLAIKHKFKF